MALSTDVNFGTEEKLGWRPDCPFPDLWIGLSISLSECSEFFNLFIFKNKYMVIRILFIEATELKFHEPL